MQKIFHFVIELFSWILVFLSPVLAFGFAAVAIYITNVKNVIISILVFSVGIIIGVILAERIRRKSGCANYLGRILATDISPIDEGKKKE
jgi:hypothetical protein